MVLAGIDEAGYGPLLGPLVVGSAAIRTPGDHLADPPNLWQRLPRHCGMRKSATGRKIHVNDSKAVYSPSLGVKELERSVFCFLLANPESFSLPPDGCISLEVLLQAISPQVLAHLHDYPWYRPQPDDCCPLDNDLLSLRLFAKSMRAEMETAQTHLVHWRASIALEEPLNRLFATTRNKSNTSFSIVARHIDHLLRTYAAEGLAIYCDRQGGRCFYGRLLRTMFEDYALEIIEEKESICRYSLRRGEIVVPITFAEKAEGKAMTVALASMLAKYTREALMDRYNRWWAGQVPGLAPTAGYYNDGQRFLVDIASKRQELGIPDEQLVRSR